MYIKSTRWLIYGILSLMIGIFGFLALVLSRMSGASSEINPLLLLPSMIISAGMFSFCCTRAIGKRA